MSHYASLPLPGEGESADILLRLPQVVRASGLSRSSIYRLVDAGAFPAPRKLSARAVAWRWRDVRAWLEQRPNSLTHEPSCAHLSQSEVPT
jgi:prophage regulatory protein